MLKLLSSLSKTIYASSSLAIIVFLILFFLNGGFAFDYIFWSWLCRFLHVCVAIMWIGLLWYFNFVQIPNMSKIPEEQKPAIDEKPVMPIGEPILTDKKEESVVPPIGQIMLQPQVAK